MILLTLVVPKTGIMFDGCFNIHANKIKLGFQFLVVQKFKNLILILSYLLSSINFLISHLNSHKSCDISFSHDYVCLIITLQVYGQLLG